MATVRYRSLSMISLPAAGIAPRRGRVVCAATSALGLLTACDEKNSYVPPPPPKVAVVLPIQRSVTRYLEVLGTSRR
jgi:hypothetical protein